MRPILVISLLAASLHFSPPAESHPMSDVRVGHLAACVSNVDVSANFLADVFGWQKFADETSRSASAEMSNDVVHSSRDDAWINADGFTLRLLNASNSKEIQCKGVGYPSLTFVTTNLPPTQDKPDGAESRTAEVSTSVAGTPEHLKMPQFVWPSATTRNVNAKLQAKSKTDTTQKTNVNRVTKPRVDRLALIVRNAEDTASFFTDVLGMRRHPETVNLEGSNNKESGGIHVVFVDANGVWLALVQPVGPGPLNAYLDSQGDGVIAELIVEVPRIADFYDLMASKNVKLVNTSGAPVDPSTKAHILEPYKDKIAYFPAETTGGLTIEIVERGDPSTSLLDRRDRGWVPIDPAEGK